MENQIKDYHLRQIEYLERDIRIISGIVEGRLENYTKHPIPVLREALSTYQNKLAQLRQEKSCYKGGCLRGVICERERAYVRTRKAKSRNRKYLRNLNMVSLVLSLPYKGYIIKVILSRLISKNCKYELDTEICSVASIGGA